MDCRSTPLNGNVEEAENDSELMGIDVEISGGSNQGSDAEDGLPDSPSDSTGGRSEAEKKGCQLDDVFSGALSSSPTKPNAACTPLITLSCDSVEITSANNPCPSTSGSTSDDNGTAAAEREEESDNFYSNPDHVWQSIRRKAAGGMSSQNSSSSFTGDEASRRTEEEAVVIKRLSVLAVKSAARHCRRSFAHYDGASALTNLADSYGISERSFNVNVPCGASAIGHSVAEEAGDMRGNELVLAAPQFWNELGGDAFKRCALKRSGKVPLEFSPKSCCGVVLEVSLVHLNSSDVERKRRRFCQLPLWRPSGGHQAEGTTLLHFDNFDMGALYYRHFFADNEHINLFSIDDGLGPVAISLRRETVEITSTSCYNASDMASRRDGLTTQTAAAVQHSPGGIRHQYRVIVRTARPAVLRGTVSEDSIVAAGAQLRPTPHNPGISVRDIVAFVAPEVQLSSLRFGQADEKVVDTLLKLDEQGLSAQYKFGVVYCKANQSTEEDMYNNEEGSSRFYEFMDCLAEKVELRGFSQYRGQLDNKNDSTGEHSYFTTSEGMEIMFHVSTLLPYTPNNRQQLLRKRHIGNDIVTIIFQEEDALPFTPAVMRSQFQHVFLVVRCMSSCPETGKPRYQVAVSQAKDMPPFSPALPATPIFTLGKDFRSLMLTKLINAESAAHNCQKFFNMSMRTRFEYLSNLAKDRSTSQGLEGSGGGSLLSRLRKQLSADKSKQANLPMATTVDLLHLPGAMVWPVVVLDWGVGVEQHQVECLLSISHSGATFLDPELHMVRCNIPPDNIAGWISDGKAMRLFYRGNGYVSFVANCGPVLSDEAVAEIVVRLNACSKGSSAIELLLRKEDNTDYGFIVHSDGVVSEVIEGLAGYAAGIRQGSRIISMDGIPVYGQPMEEVVTHLREAKAIKAMVIPPTMDNIPRGGRHPSSGLPAGEDSASSNTTNSFLAPPRSGSGYNGRASPEFHGGGMGRRQSLKRKIPVGEKWMQEVCSSAATQRQPRARAASIDSPSLRGVVRKAKDKLAAKSSMQPAPSPMATHRRTPSTTMVPGMNSD
eukprot:scpid11267/ scgid27437/ Signal-induced proliferation-associated 1-like protein 3; SPA-1-like protein 3